MNYKYKMLKIKHIKQVKVVTVVASVVGFVLGLSGCLEKEEFPSSAARAEEPFALFKIQMALIDFDSQEPLADVLVKLVNNASATPFTATSAEQVSDSTGIVHLAVASAPRAPKEFLFSCTDTTQTRMFQQGYISVLFFAPVFTYFPKDAAVWGTRYQGTTELAVTRELTQMNDE